MVGTCYNPLDMSNNQLQNGIILVVIVIVALLAENLFFTFSARKAVVENCIVQDSSSWNVPSLGADNQYVAATFKKAKQDVQNCIKLSKELVPLIYIEDSSK